MNAKSKSMHNSILANLNTIVLDRLIPFLERIEMLSGDITYDSAREQTHIYFPVTSVITLFHVREEGKLVKISMIGKEGFIGLPFFLIGNITPCRAMVQTEGWAYRLSARLLAQEFNRNGVAARPFLRYANTLMAQIEQTSLCDQSWPHDQNTCPRCTHASACPFAAMPSGFFNN